MLELILPKEEGQKKIKKENFLDNDDDANEVNRKLKCHLENPIIYGEIE